MTFENIVRSAVITDQRPLFEMLKETSYHRHLDWREPLDWIGSPSFLVLERGGKLIGALVCPLDPPGAAWLRLFACTPGGNARQVWQVLWEAAAGKLPGSTTAAAISMMDWMASLLVGSGFTVQQTLVMLEREEAELPGRYDPEPGVTIRPMLVPDLPAVAETDAASFEPLWQNSLPDLTRALSRAFLAAVAEKEGRVIGYQVSTRTSFGIHLARLAVRPEAQGYGIGQSLVNDLFHHAERRGIRHFTVNTQGDNSISLMLYKKLGFVETGEQYPVYKLQI